MIFQKVVREDDGTRYGLKFEYSNGDVSYIKPLACDNPKSIYGKSDRSIKRKAERLAKELTKNDDLACSVITYREDKCPACNKELRSITKTAIRDIFFCNTCKLFYIRNKETNG